MSTPNIGSGIPAPTKVKEANYPNEVVDALTARYLANPVRETVNAIAADIGRSERSVISKLSHMGLYVAPPRTTKSGAPIVRKSELVARIAAHLELDVPSLEKANKSDLALAADALDELLGSPEEVDELLA